MSLTSTPATPYRTRIIETWLKTLPKAERDDALGYLRNPDMYSHVDLADALSKEIGHDVSEASVRRWRRKHC